jgi:hypothetical protein
MTDIDRVNKEVELVRTIILPRIFQKVSSLSTIISNVKSSTRNILDNSSRNKKTIDSEVER